MGIVRIVRRHYLGAVPLSSDWAWVVMMTWEMASKLLGVLKQCCHKKQVKKTARLSLKRWIFSFESTVGKLYLNEQFICHTLEDTVRDTKIYGKTAIPCGEYEVVINYSPRYKRKLPRLKDVPNFKGILIHPGNSAKDTDGCILVGEYGDRVNWVSNSRRTFNRLLKKLQEFDKITIEVK